METFDTYGGFYKGHTSKRFVVSLCIVKGIFLGGHISHIASSMRGISLKRFVANLLY